MNKVESKKTEVNLIDYSIAAINARLKIDDEDDQDFLEAADQKALASYMKELKANPSMTKEDLTKSAKINLAAEHGLDFDDLNEDWSSYIEIITSHQIFND